MSQTEKTILVAGATGYVGGRLVPRLLQIGHRVRVLGRSLPKLSCRPWANHPQVELVKADVLDLGSLYSACKGARAAYYLVHSMSKGVTDFAATEAITLSHGPKWAAFSPRAMFHAPGSKPL